MEKMGITLAIEAINFEYLQEEKTAAETGELEIKVCCVRITHFS